MRAYVPLVAQTHSIHQHIHTLYNVILNYATFTFIYQRKKLKPFKITLN